VRRGQIGELEQDGRRLRVRVAPDLRDETADETPGADKKDK
jgi:hypothetical protein